MMPPTLDPHVLLAIPLLPLAAAVLAGLGARVVPRALVHTCAILAVAAAFGLSLRVLRQLVLEGAPDYDAPVYTWLVSDGMHVDVGFLVDRLTALMMCVVTFVSLCVHVYTIGYMHDDPGYNRFFSYIALFTFAMLMLVMSNNFMQLYFGWEGVGVVSYLLIGFWYTRPSAIFANLKAFVVNRVGDFGMVLGIAAIAWMTHSLDYASAFAAAPTLAQAVVPLGGGTGANALTLICVCLFIGAMAKSAQVPLHVWLPDSMEGPTPISALIHAATMVTAGIYMVARMSPLYEHSEAALSMILVLGGTTAFFMGLLGIVATDIKRVIAYSTISQLGYMAVALGASAYPAAIFHLMTHAAFKALLFLAAGSVIIGMHHEQDMRRMGGLGKYMPVTAITCWIGGLALVGMPFFSGFYSKDTIIEAVGAAHRAGATYAYWCTLLGVFVTSLYTFRLLFLTFHGEERFRHAPAADAHAHAVVPHESPAVVTLPLIALAIPALVVGGLTVRPLLYGGWFGGAMAMLPANDVLARLGEEFPGPTAMALHGFFSVPFALVLAGAATAWTCCLYRPQLADRAAHAAGWLYFALVNKFGFDWLNERVIAPCVRALGTGLWKGGDQVLIDGALVNGTAGGVGLLGGLVRRLQTGYLYTYAFWMVMALAALLGWFLLHSTG